MRIGIDIDNVLSNFNEVLLEQYLKHDKKLNGNGIINKNVYVRQMFDWSKEYEEEFYKSNIESFASLFKPIKDCSKYIKKLKEEKNEIYIISGRDNGDYSNPYNMTVNWLDSNAIYYDKLILTNSDNKQSKANICIENNIDIMIDDSVGMCSNCVSKGIKTFLMDTPYNKDNSEIERVYSWEDIYYRLSNKKINVILDTDAYNECDDQFALSYLIKSQDRFNIEAITVAPFSHNSRNVTTMDSQDLSYNEIIKICNWLHFDTIDKVFKGSTDYINNGYNHDNDSVNRIIEIALKNDKTYILAIGAITNIALAIKKEPKIIDKIEIIWLGGNDLNYKDNLEYNFKQDIEAVRMVFGSNTKLTIIPCKNVASILKTDIKTLNKNMINNNINKYLKDRFYNDGYHGFKESRVIWDISVIAYMINRNWFETKKINCPNIKYDTSYEIINNNRLVNIVIKINKDEVYKDLFKKLGN